MECEDIVFSGHAVRRMFERGIDEIDVAEVIAEGELIDEYPDDKPFPACCTSAGRTSNPSMSFLG